MQILLFCSMNKETISGNLTPSDDFMIRLSGKLAEGLRGFESHNRMAPLLRFRESEQEPPAEAIQSSVLLLLYPKEDKMHTAVILRSDYDGVHSGQISLPGGRKEPFDQDHEATALRESMEETGIIPSEVKILGSLSRLYIDRSNYVVHPFVGFSRTRPVFNADPVEVKEIVEIDLEKILSPAAIITKQIKLINGVSFEVPGYDLGKHFMWGATAMIFSEFLEVLRSVIV